MLSLDTLDTTVIKTIRFFEEEHSLPSFDPQSLRFPLVVGSGNGAETGKILFRKVPALFATESDAQDKMHLAEVQEVVVVSASGSKHAPILMEQAKTAGKIAILISSTAESDASRRSDHSYIFPKIVEPYTYNTSTYFAYLYGMEKDRYDLHALDTHIHQQVAPLLETGTLQDYRAFFIVLPNEFSLLKNMIETKFVELFGRQVARDVATYEQVKHAMTVVGREDELFICFGNTDGVSYGKHQINIPLLDHVNYSAMMLTDYWVVGRIQKALPPYFMENIASYCEHNPHFSITPLVS